MDELPLPASRSARERRAPAANTQVNLTQVRDQARRNAREEGYKQGYQEGHEAGLAAGREEGVEQGYADGVAKGLEEGRALAQQELQQQLREMLEPMKPMAEQFDQALVQLRDEIATDLVELAFEAGKHLAREHLDAKPWLILSIVRDLLHTEPMLSGKPRVWLHPDDLMLVREQLGTEFDAAGWTLQPDDQITRGGCRATSQSGEIDATWESRWEAMMARTRRRRRRQIDDEPEIGE